MKCYIAATWSDEAMHIDLVFTTRELAEAYVNANLRAAFDEYMVGVSLGKLYHGTPTHHFGLNYRPGGRVLDFDEFVHRANGEWGYVEAFEMLDALLVEAVPV